MTGARALPRAVPDHDGMARDVSRPRRSLEQSTRVTRTPHVRNHLLVVGGDGPFRATRANGTIVFRINARDAERLADDRSLAKFRYQGLRP